MKVFYSCVALAAASVFLQAQSSTVLDSSFGTNGIATNTVQNPHSESEAIAVQADGKMVVAGYSGGNSTSQMSVIRLNADGSLDTTFANQGKLRFNVGNGQSFFKDVKIQSDGKIVLGGYSWATNFTGNFVAVRLNTDGSFDNTFGNNGIAVLDDGKNEVANALMILPDGRILIAGYTDDNFSMAMVKSNGTLDTTFGIGGWTVTPIAGTFSYARSIARLSTGEIILGGFVYAGNGTEMAAVKYTANGVIDTTFGDNGVVAFNIGPSTDFVEGIAVQNDGKILLGGHTYTNNNPLRYDIAVVRLNANGTFDNTYGNAGVARARIVENGENYTSKLAILPTGEALIAGKTVDDTQWNACMVRFTTNGTLDPNFGTNGKISLDINNGTDEGRGLAIQDDHKVLLTGNTYDSASGIEKMFVARYRSSALGVADFNPSMVQLYPGIATSEINISLGNTSKNAEVSIYTTTGQKVKTEKISQSGKIKVSDLTSGTYIVEIKSGNSTVTKKFIKH